MQDKILSIIIPYYKETAKEMFPILSSINNQVGVNFDEIECILVNDGNNNILPSEFLSLFEKLNIRCIYMKENRGAGVARQVGIDNAEGEYVMFCDADDVLHSVAVIGAFINEINENHPDIITSSWLEEMYDENTSSYIYINHENEITWMHGKVIRRLFLQTKNIRFHEKLRIHEDSYFLAIASAATTNQRKLMFTSYIWKYNPTSITRCNNAKYTYESIPIFTEAMNEAFKVLRKRNSEEMPYKVIQFIMYNYFLLHRSDWLADENEKYLKKAEQAFGEMISEYMKYYHEAPYEMICTVYNQERAKMNGNSIETEHLSSWLQRILANKEKAGE